MIRNKALLVTYKLVFAALGLSAVVTEIAVLSGLHKFAPVNFFSFFTVESNVFAAVILVISAVAILRGRTVAHLSLLRGATTLYMVTTGIVFSVLLAGLDPRVLTAVPWDNTVLHYIMPVVLIVDWIVDPPASVIRFKKALVWLLFPLAYVVYSVVRGAIVGWYPYPFINPDVNGYGGVLVTSLGITVLILALTAILVRGGNRLRTRTLRRHA